MTQQLSERGQRRRQALLDAATHTFLQHGYERTTLDMIIAQAGGSRRSLYEYFGDKRGLFSAVIAHHAHKMVHDIRSLELDGLTAREGLELLGHAFFNALTDTVNLELYRLLIAEGSAFAQLGQTVYEAGPHMLQEQLQLYLQCLHDRGLLSGAQPPCRPAVFRDDQGRFPALRPAGSQPASRRNRDHCTYPELRNAFVRQPLVPPLAPPVCSVYIVDIRHPGLGG